MLLDKHKHTFYTLACYRTAKRYTGKKHKINRAQIDLLILVYSTCNSLLTFDVNTLLKLHKLERQRSTIYTTLAGLIKSGYIVPVNNVGLYTLSNTGIQVLDSLNKYLIAEIQLVTGNENGLY